MFSVVRISECLMHFCCTAIEVPTASNHERYVDRQEQITALYARVSNQVKPSKVATLTTAIPLGEEERFQKLMAGEFTGDHSAADFALCILLAKRHGCNAFKIDAEFRKSGLYRDKWEREDYRDSTITRAITAVIKESPALFVADDAEEFVDDGVDEYNSKSSTRNLRNHSG